jgi:hypothetical protein
VAAVLGVAELLTTTLAFGLIAVAAWWPPWSGPSVWACPSSSLAFVVAAGGRARFRPPDRDAAHQAAAAAAHRNRRAGRPSAIVLEEVTGTAGGSASAARNGRPAPTTSRW